MKGIRTAEVWEGREDGKEEKGAKIWGITLYSIR
jgi:hypothetical protein